jgi:hypothetical protein
MSSMKEFIFHGRGYYESEDIVIWAENFSVALCIFMKFHDQQDDKVKMLHLRWRTEYFNVTIDHHAFDDWEYFVNPEGTNVVVEEKVAFYSFCYE